MSRILIPPLENQRVKMKCAVKLQGWAFGVTGRWVAAVFLAWASIPPLCAQTHKAGSPNPIRAMWVWNSGTVLGSAEEAGRLFAFCAKTGVNRIFLSIDLERRESSFSPRFAIRGLNGYRDFLERAHERQVEVEALVGSPEWATPGNHQVALAAIEVVLEFNKASPRLSRFDGIHFDVEPYLLLGYADSQKAKILLVDFLRMVSVCARRVGTVPGFRFTCDVPAYFFFGTEAEAGQFSVEFNGRRKTVGEHLADLLPLVTIMDYRNHAEGAGGAIAWALPALRYAKSKGKGILVGVETSSEAERTAYFVCSLPRAEFRTRLAVSGMGDLLFWEGWRLATFSDDINVHVGLVAPQDSTGAKRAEFEAALVRFAAAFGATPVPGGDPSDDKLDMVRDALTQDPEWNGFEPFELIDPETRDTVKGFRTSLGTAPQSTFHGLGPDTFKKEIGSLEEKLRQYSSYGGLAIHHYESYRELLERK